MATQEEIEAGAAAIEQTHERYIIGTVTAGNTPVSVFEILDDGNERRVLGPAPMWECEKWLRNQAVRAALEAAERVREGLSKSRARRLGHFVMTGDDVLIREDRPE